MLRSRAVLLPRRAKLSPAPDALHQDPDALHRLAAPGYSVTVILFPWRFLTVILRKIRKALLDVVGMGTQYILAHHI